MKAYLFLLLLVLLPCAIANSNGDLTERLAGDSDAMEGVVGAREAEDLVDEALRGYEAKQAKAEKAAHLAEQESQQSFRDYDEARKEAAENDAEERHLKTKLAIVLETETNDSKVAERAEAIAKRMAALAAKAEAQWKHVHDEKEKTQSLFDAVTTKAKSVSATEAAAHKKRQEAEAEAQKSSATVAHLDLKITQLLDRRSRLKDIAAAEDKKASSRFIYTANVSAQNDPTQPNSGIFLGAGAVVTHLYVHAAMTACSLVEAFQEDASRQEKFRESLLREKAVEREHRKQVPLCIAHSVRERNTPTQQTYSVRQLETQFGCPGRAR
jgi:hypothetical protein